MGIIAVCGAGAAGAELSGQAEAVGRGIALRGHILACGGLGGVMQAAARGAKEAGGVTIGILPGNSKDEANAYIDIPIVTGLGEARNLILVKTADAVIALTGEFGTLSEIALALKIGKPVVGLNTWRVSERMMQAQDPDEAVELAIRGIIG